MREYAMYEYDNINNKKLNPSTLTTQSILKYQQSKVFVLQAKIFKLKDGDNRVGTYLKWRGVKRGL